MSGGNEVAIKKAFYRRAAGLSILIAPLTLSACIPPGAGDYRIGSSGQTPPATEEVPPPPAPKAQPVTQSVTPTAAWNPAIVQKNARYVAATTYTVGTGDTLYRIGNVTGAGAEAIANVNGLTPPYALKIGQQLAIPGGVFHRVGAGETGIAIARAYSAPWNEIVSLNVLAPPYALRAGQYLQLPNSVLQTPNSAQPAGQSTPESRASAFNLNIDDIVTGSQPAAPEPGRPASVLNTTIATPASYAGSFSWPLRGRLASSFGSKGGGRVNDGINIAAGLGSPVQAAGDGVVVYSGNEIAVFGGLVLVDHGSGWVTAYGHLGQLNVTRGDRVRRGQALGTVGNTGYVDTPQLHFQIRKDRKPIDPMTKLAVS